MDYLKLGLSGLTPKQLATKARTITQRMTDNANFATPSPALADITQALNELETAIGDASTGSTIAKMERDHKASIMKVMLTNLASYVTMVAEGDGMILKSSGFELRKDAEPIGNIEVPTNFMADRGEKSGTAKLTWKPVHGAKSYVIEVTTTDPSQDNTKWEIAAITTKTRNVLSNLIIREYYWYRVKAVGSAEQSDYSNVNLVLAA